MKIGILTYHNAMNYGAILQAYALQKWLVDRNNNVEVINYCNNQVELSYRQFRYKLIPKRNPIDTIQFIAVNLYRYFKYKKVRVLIGDILKLSRKISGIGDRNYLKKYDLIIVGSDQLWNDKITGGYDPMYWGAFNNPKQNKVITYAICMNKEITENNDRKIIKSFLSNFAAISVREKTTQLLLNTIINPNTPCKLCVDPTLLLSAKQWKEEINETVIPKEKYVCVYAIIDTDKVINIAKEYSKERNLKCIIINPLSDSHPFSKAYQPNSPFDFISIISNSEMVFTSSFHGLVFSIIFERLFYVIGDAEKNNRMDNLLNMLNISNRFVNTCDEITGEMINYSIVRKKWAELKSQSEDFLFSCLSI